MTAKAMCFASANRHRSKRRLAFGAASAVSAQQSLPDWLKQDAHLDARTPTPLSPSSAYDETILVRIRGSQLERKKALARGEAVHRLLQSLPDLPPEVRAKSARRHLARLPDFDASERESMLSQVLALLDDTRFAELFMAGSRAEVPIVGRLVPRTGVPPLRFPARSTASPSPTMPS